MLKGRYWKGLFLGASLCIGLIAGCAGSGIDGGNLPGEVKNDSNANTNQNPNAPIAQQVFLIANRVTGTTYTNNLTAPVNLPAQEFLNRGPVNTLVAGTSGTVTLATQISNTTDPSYGRLATTSTASVFNGTNGGLGTNWVAVAPKVNPSPGQTSMYVYTVNGFQSFPSQSPAPVPANANPVPSPIPILNPVYIGDDSLAIGQADFPNTQVAQSSANGTSSFAGNIQFTTPPLANVVPGLLVYGVNTRLYANYVHPTTNRFMYVTCGDGVLSYRLEQNGAITELARTSCGAGTARAKAIAFSADGNFMYVTCDTGHVAGFRIDQQSGSITPVPGSPVVTGVANPTAQTVNALGVTFDRSGKFLYVVNQGIETLAGYSVDNVTGALAALPNFPISRTNGTFPAFIINSPNRDILYMSNTGPNCPIPRGWGTGLAKSRYGSNGITAGGVPPTTWAVDPNTGQLTELPFTTSVPFSNKNSLALALDASGQNLYVSNAADPPAYDLFNTPIETRGTFGGGVTAFRINTDGTLTSEGSGQEATTGQNRDPNGILPVTIRNF